MALLTIVIRLTCMHCSCYNAFSRLDIRVEVKIPGGVESYCVDTNGERYVSVSVSVN